VARHEAVLCFVILLVILTFVGILAFSPLAVFALDVSARSINADAVWNQGITGSGVCVAVVDTGISTVHPSLSDRVVHSEDFTDEGTVDDLSGHGTHVAGIVAGTGSPYKGVAFVADVQVT
jgi:subtilisin family serine protease